MNYLGLVLYVYKGNESNATIEVKEETKSIAPYAFYGSNRIVSVKIPNTVTVIGNYAFSDCSSLKSVDLPESVVAINTGTFDNCLNLQVPPLHDKITQIGEAAFKDCQAFKSLVIPPLVTTIGEQAFWHCKGLTEVEIGESVTSIGAEAFIYCDSIKKVWCKNPVPPKVENSSIPADIRENATLYVPTGSSDRYCNIFFWRLFKEVVEVDYPDAGTDIVAFDDTKVVAENSVIRVLNAKDDTEVQVVNVSNGAVVYQGSKKSITAHTGLYIVVVDGKSHKVMVR